MKSDYLEATWDWVKRNKVPDGRAKNQFALDAECKDKDLTADTMKKLRTAGEHKRLSN